jgi:predicted MPP superfamily phosphohydrolase
MPVFLLLCFYIGYRLFGYLRQIFPKIKKIPFWLIYSIFPLCFMVSSYLPISPFAKLLSVIGYIYLSFFVFAFFLLVIADIVRLVLLLTHRLPPKGEKRRRLHIVSGSVVCGLLVTLVVGGMINAFSIRTTDYDIKINKQCSLQNLKLVAVSDIHLGYQIGSGHLADMVEEINAQNPDIVVIVGDIFDSSTDMVFDLSRAQEFFSEIKSKYGVFAVLGNHDVYTNKMEQFFSASNITLLKDESILIADSFYIVGRNDRNLLTGDRYGRAELSNIMKDTDKSKPVIVLDHRPQSFEEEKENGSDLVLSGHTHEGQIFPINLITDKIYTTDYGHGVYGDMQVIVTSGVGLWGPPVRIGTRAEIAAINVTFSD